MSTFVDIGTMRASFDTKTGNIRLTSTENDLPLKSSGFSVNIHQGSKEYVLLSELLSKQSGEIHTYPLTQYQLEKVLEATNVTEKAQSLIQVKRWEDDNTVHKAAVSAVANSLIPLAPEINKNSDKRLSSEQWFETLNVLLLKETEEILTIISSVVEKQKTSESQNHPYQNHAKHIFEKLEDDETIKDAVTVFSSLVHSVSIAYRKSNTLPHIAHLSNKHRSSIDDLIPVGVATRDSIVSWNVKDNAHLIIEGDAGSGKTVLINTILDHVSHHRKTLRAVVFTQQAKEVSKGIPFFEENIDVHEYDYSEEEVHSIIWKSWKMMRSRYRFSKGTDQIRQKLASGEFKRTFLVLDDFHKFFSLADFNKSEKSKESLGYLKEILQDGKLAGVHLVVSDKSVEDFFDEETLKGFFARSDFFQYRKEGVGISNFSQLREMDEEKKTKTTWKAKILINQESDV